MGMSHVNKVMAPAVMLVDMAVIVTVVMAMVVIFIKMHMFILFNFDEFIFF